MPYVETPPLGGNASLLQDLIRRMDVLEARTRVIQNGALIIRNNAGVAVAVIGQQADGTYGLKVANDAGVLQRIGGAQSVFGADLTGKTNISWATPLDCQLTVDISASGQALVTSFAEIFTYVSGQVGGIGVIVDSSTPYGTSYFSVSAGAAYIGGQSNEQRTLIISGLSQGSHVFKFAYQVQQPGASSVDFYSPSLTIQPL